MKKKNKYTYLAKNTILFTISSFGSKILSFFLVPLYTAVLSTADYGTADLVTTTAGLLVYILTLDIQSAVLRFAIERKEKQEEILNFGLEITGIGSIVLAIGLLILKSLSLLDWPDYCYLFLFLSFLFSALNSIILNYLRAIDKTAAVAAAGIITTLIMIVSNLVLLLVFRIGVVGYMISTLLGYATSIAYSIFLIRKQCINIFREHCSKNVKKAMCAYSIPLIFNAVAWWMNSSIDKYFITAMLGVAANGIYAVSQKIPSILSMFNTIFGQAWNLSAIREFDPDDKDGFFTNTYKMYNTALVLVCSVLILINIPLARILFSNDFFEAWQFSSTLLISMIFSAMASFLGCIFSAVKKNKVFAVSTVAAAATNIVLNVVMIPVFGALGAAIATAVSFFVMWFIRWICARKYIRMKVNLFLEFVVYILLTLQVVFEHMDGHFYIGQIIVFVIIIFLYRKTVYKIFKMLLTMITNIKDKRKTKN